MSPQNHHPPLPPPRERRPSQVEIDQAVANAVQEALAEDAIRDHEQRIRVLEASRMEHIAELANMKERKTLSTTAKITLASAIIGVIGAVLVVVVQWALAFSDSVKQDSVKQSKGAAANVVASAAPSMAEVYERGAEAGAARVLAKLKQEQEAQGLVTVPRDLVRAKPPKPQP